MKIAILFFISVAVIFACIATENRLQNHGNNHFNNYICHICLHILSELAPMNIFCIKNFNHYHLCRILLKSIRKMPAIIDLKQEKKKIERKELHTRSLDRTENRPAIILTHFKRKVHETRSPILAKKLLYFSKYTGYHAAVLSE